MHNPDNYVTQVVETLFGCLQIAFFCRDSAVFIFPTLLADFKDPIQNRNRVSSYIKLVPPQFFYFNVISVRCC